VYRAGPVPPGTGRTGPVPNGSGNPGDTSPLCPCIPQHDTSSGTSVLPIANLECPCYPEIAQAPDAHGDAGAVAWIRSDVYSGAPTRGPEEWKTMTLTGEDLANGTKNVERIQI
jgi:hypothetical protein